MRVCRKVEAARDSGPYPGKKIKSREHQVESSGDLRNLALELLNVQSCEFIRTVVWPTDAIAPAKQRAHRPFGPTDTSVVTLHRLQSDCNKHSTLLRLRKLKILFERM
jgi:hypothetical protein